MKLLRENSRHVSWTTIILVFEETNLGLLKCCASDLETGSVKIAIFSFLTDLFHFIKRFIRINYSKSSVKNALFCILTEIFLISLRFNLLIVC